MQTRPPEPGANASRHRDHRDRPSRCGTEELSSPLTALERLLRPELDGFWIHIDCDALDDAVMPAVDYRLPGGLTWDELQTVLQLAVASGRAVGVEITIFNPALDDDGSIAEELVRCLARGLRR